MAETASIEYLSKIQIFSSIKVYCKNSTLVNFQNVNHKLNKMSLKEKSEELKALVSTYESKWFLGDLSFTIHSGRERAFDQLGQLSSPMRQLHYLAGLNISTDKEIGIDYIYDQEKCNKIVFLLNEIEEEYQKMLLEKNKYINFENWKKSKRSGYPFFLNLFQWYPSYQLHLA